MKTTKIEFSRQGNFILTLLLIYFVFYGYLCNSYDKSIGEGVMFLYQVLFVPGPTPSSLEQVIFLIIYIAIIILPIACKFVIKWSTRDSLQALIISQGAFIFAFFSPDPLFIYFAIIFIMVFREQFFEYGIRNSIWITPFVIGMSWMWAFLIDPGSNLLVVIGTYFIRIEGYLTIVTLLGINLLTAILASSAKEKYKQYSEKMKLIEV